MRRGGRRTAFGVLQPRAGPAAAKRFSDGDVHGLFTTPSGKCDQTRDGGHTPGPRPDATNEVRPANQLSPIGGEPEEEDMNEAKYFLRLTERCHRLARQCTDPGTASQLTTLGDEFLNRAAQLSAKLADRHPRNLSSGQVTAFSSSL